MLSAEESMNRAVFLDRDGTINDNSSHVNRPQDLKLYKGVAEALKMLSEAGFRLVVVTNQGGVSLGHMDDTQMTDINRRLVEILMSQGVFLDAVYASTWHERGDQGRGDDPSWRKPEPGMLLSAAESMGIDLSASFMVGDRATDILAGKKAGCKTVLVLCGDGRRAREELAEQADITAGDLLQAAREILTFK